MKALARETAPFVLVTLMAIGISLGLRRLLGPERRIPVWALRVAGVALLVFAVATNQN
ncbi:MAG: hypothetical protein JWO77_749 [Ilumatobacteraceae bacterium]|nr:hypothetical protein [Ilumatobacteraceae bacterium]